MRTKSRAQVAAGRAKGQRPRGQKPKPYTGPMIVRAPISYRTYIQSPSGRMNPGPTTLIGDDMRQKFALRGRRDLELSKAYTEAEVNAILTKYGDLS